jgi:DNA repair protein RadC
VPRRWRRWQSTEKLCFAIEIRQESAGSGDELASTTCVFIPRQAGHSDAVIDNKMGNYLSRPLDTAEAVYRVNLEMRCFRQEVVRVVLLDVQNCWITSVDVCKGTLDESLAHPRDIFRPVIVHGAVGFVVVHNHPSGDARPSAADVRLTQRVVKGARILEVGFLDHVIVGRRIRKHPGYFSFQEAGLL